MFGNLASDSFSAIVVLRYTNDLSLGFVKINTILQIHFKKTQLNLQTLYLSFFKFFTVWFLTFANFFKKISMCYDFTFLLNEIIKL